MWPTASFAANTSNGVYIGHLDSVLYATNSQTDNFPVRGYIVGGTKEIWSYSGCDEPDFGFSVNEMLFSSPELNTNLGVIAKIEIDSKSCNNELV